jgi:type IX secretion system PorP/SprF family membrane protein
MFFCYTVSAQQDPQHSFYFFNPLQFNSAYAGTRGTLSVVGAHRSQWVGWEGAPTTQFLSIHAPVARQRIGLGGTLNYDKIGVRTTMQGLFHFAFLLPLNDNGLKLSMGLSGGFYQHSYNFSELRVTNLNDPNFSEPVQTTNFNYGCGFYLHNSKFFTGISIPHFVKQDLQSQSGKSILLPHVFVAAGYIIKFNSVVDFKPSILIKTTANSPTTIDFNAAAFFYKKIWIGAMYRWNEAIGFNTALQINEQLMLGYSFEFPINSLRVKQWGSHELVVLIDITSKKKANYSPRYF